MARVALVTDPDVAVVVVASLLGTLGQARGRGGDHATARAGHTPQNGVRLAGVCGRDRVVERWHRRVPRLFGGDPGAGGVNGPSLQRGCPDLEYQVVAVPLVEREVEDEPTARGGGVAEPGFLPPDQRR